MTGQDSILNKRITSILINQIEEFKQLLVIFDENEMASIEFITHKIRPSLLIFEMDTVVKQYSDMMEVWEKNGQSPEMKTQKEILIENLDKCIANLKAFLSSIS